MEQSKFIYEVQSRPCIWDPRAPSYVDRALKRLAWEEVAVKMYQGFHSCFEYERKEKVRELQKKWKSLKDYYKRRNPNEDLDEETLEKKPLLRLLQFLDNVTKFDHHLRAQERLAEQIKRIKNRNLVFQLPDYKITVQKFNESQSKPSDARKNWCTKLNAENGPQQNDVMFLLSLLPVMQTLDDRQRFEFKLEVMMLLKKLKYQGVEETQSNINISRQDHKKQISI